MIDFLYDPEKTFYLDCKFQYKQQNYNISGQYKYRPYRKDMMMVFNFGYAGDDFPCIKLEYNLDKNEFHVWKLRAQAFGSSPDSDRVTCLQPSLPVKGALDILVMFSLGFAEKIAPDSTVYILDAATVDDNKPLSWLKFFEKSTTTYAKYGFIRRKNTLKFKDSESSSIFKFYMKTAVPHNLNQKLDTILSPKTLKLLKSEYVVQNINLKRYNYKPIIFNSNDTLLKVVKAWSKTPYCDEIFKIINDEFEFDIRGVWYLSWSYYHNLPIFEKIQKLKIKFKI